MRLKKLFLWSFHLRMYSSSGNAILIPYFVVFVDNFTRMWTDGNVTNFIPILFTFNVTQLSLAKM